MNSLLRVLPILCFLAIPVRADEPRTTPDVPRDTGVWLQDNALIDVSAGLISAVVMRDIDQTQPVRDVVMGNPVTGTARTRGKVTAVLVPDPSFGVVDLYIRGVIVSDTVAAPPDTGLLIYSTTTIPFILRKRVWIDATGLHTFPTQVRATAKAKLRKVITVNGNTDTPGTNIAEAAFEAKKEDSERYAVDQATTQMIQQFDAELAPQLAKGNAAFAKQIHDLRAKGVPLQRLDFRTSASLLSLGGWITATGHNWPMSPPPTLQAPFDVAARIHQTAIIATFRAMLGGKTFTVDELGGMTGDAKQPAHFHLAQSSLGVVPKELGVSQLSVTFADDPLAVNFADQGFTMAVRVRAVTAGRLRLPGMTLSTAYRFETVHGRVEAVRQGPVRVQPFQHAQLGIQQASGIGIMQKSLNKVFKERLAVPNLQTPAEMGQIGTLVLTRADIHHGWLSLAWIRVPKS